MVWRRGLAFALVVLTVSLVLWVWWAETHPREERQLRSLVGEKLHAWFPEQMAPESGQYGIFARTPATRQGGPRVLLIHGLDEPGSIWDDLIPELAADGFEVWEFIYPNDQGIDRSAEALAAHWNGFPPGPPMALIGHSMGGLVARDFVARIRHPVGSPALVSGPEVSGVIQVGTPNLGSEWARLRLWLELRDQFISLQNKRFSLFAALRDGTGEAKIDLRPSSDFLAALNARPWPDAIPIQAIAGQLLEAPDPSAGFAALVAEVRYAPLAERLDRWWAQRGEDLGDGVVPLASARIPGGPEPILVEASHRGLLLRRLPNDPEPPAIAPIRSLLGQWRRGSD